MQTSELTPDAALTRLKEGNQRYVSGTGGRADSSRTRREETAAHGQRPFAAVLGCSDSRVPLEILLDQGVGDIFTVRVAGNVCNQDEIASIEYALAHLGVPLCVVMGHTQCGAVTAVAGGANLEGGLFNLTYNIRHALEKVKYASPGLSGAPLIEATIKENIWRSIEDLFSDSIVARQNVKQGALSVVGACYDIASGAVEWLGEHPAQNDLLG